MQIISLIFRRLKKNKVVNILGISSLVVGLVCTMYIFLWVTNEVQFDSYHDKLDRIFAVHAYLEGGKDRVNFNGCPPAVAPAIKDEYPEIIEAFRYMPPYFQYLIRTGNKQFTENTSLSEFELFDIFSFPFVYGGKGEQGDPNRIVLTETTSRKLFGNINPVGKIVNLDNRLDMTVVGVIEDIPQNSYFNFNAVIPIENIAYYYSRDNYLTSWYNNSYTTFGLLADESGFEKVASTITDRIQKELPNSTNYLRAYKFKNRYLYEDNNIRSVRIFSLIAILVLISAALNFINLSTARTSKQAKETGLRKTIGASRRSIIKLIYSDVALVTLIAFVLSLLIVFLGLPVFNNRIGTDIHFSLLFSKISLLGLGCIYIFTVLSSGSYPAFFLSSFSPIKTLSLNYKSSQNRGLLRNSMVVVVFIVSIVLLNGTLIIYQQTNHLRNMDLGYDREQLMYVELNGQLREKATTLKEEISRNPGVLGASFVSNLPTQIGNNGEAWNWQGKDPEYKPLVTNWRVDHNMLETFGASMAEGKFFMKNQPGILINKTFAKLIGWESFEGKTINGYGNDYIIRGVFNDIHFNRLSEEIKPMAVYQLNPGESQTNFLVIKVNTENIDNTLAHIRTTCKNIEPSYPFSYEFLDDKYNQLLSSEINLRKLIGIFSVFAILVLALGILGLILFLAEQKIKEIGIRKCMGENVLSICGRFIKPFVLSGLIASIIGMPLTWIAMDKWLQNYANRINLNAWTFILSGLLVILIAILTVFWQSWRAANRNPVEALRYE